jgi:hypothetical protein
MTLDEARSCLERGEPDVLYRPAHGEPELGVITSVSDAWVFVRYGTQASVATDPADLEALTPEQARRWLWRHPLRTGGGNG